VEKTWNNGNFHGKTCGKRVELEKHWVYMVYKHKYTRISAANKTTEFSSFKVGI
jgi:hypothetical protein